jgi:hypothetical protein
MEEFKPYLHLFHISYFATKNTKIPQEVHWHSWVTRSTEPPSDEDVRAFSRMMHPGLEFDMYEFKYVEPLSEKYH